MKKQAYLAVLLIVAVVILLWLLRKPASTALVKEQAVATQANAPIENKQSNVSVPLPAAPKPANEFQAVKAHMEQVRQRQEQLIALAQSPLLYYGKVVDESNEPISGVRVTYTAQTVSALREDVFNSGAVTSDEHGIFKIDGINGIGLMLELSHSNYYPYPENSTGFDKRSIPRKGYFSDTEEKAELFRMHSKGHPVPLIFRSGGFHAPDNGSIANYPFRGNTRSEILGQLQIQGWSGLRSETNSYDWKVQLTVPSGGIIETTNYFDSVAPKTGYSDSVHFEVSGGESARKTYFIKLSTGYIRFKLEVIMGRDMFVTGDYYFNPDGSRNLEAGHVIHPTQ